MELTADYLQKFQPSERKSGEPRSEREALILQFKEKLNKDRKAQDFPPFSDGYMVKLFAEYPTGNLHQLFKECMAAQKFGGMLKWKLAEYHKV